jgi:hypothetical protein
VDVVVVVDEFLDDPARAPQAGPGPDEHVLGPGGDEAVHQILGERAVDLGRLSGRQLQGVPARIEHVHVGAVLVGGVTQPAEPLPERPSVWPAQVRDADPGSKRVGEPVLGDDAEDPVDHAVGAPATPVPVGRAAQRKVPGEEVGALRRQLHAAQESAVPGPPDGDRPAPLELPGVHLLDLRLALGGLAVCSLDVAAALRVPRDDQEQHQEQRRGSLQAVADDGPKNTTPAR